MPPARKQSKVLGGSNFTLNLQAAHCLFLRTSGKYNILAKDCFLSRMLGIDYRYFSEKG